MEYKVFFSCGHADYVQLFEEPRDNIKKIEELKGCMCPSCERAAQETKLREIENRYNLPKLAGNVPNIDYVRRVRAFKISQIMYAAKKMDENVEALISEGTFTDELERSYNTLADAIERCRKKKSAEFWLYRDKADVMDILCEV